VSPGADAYPLAATVTSNVGVMSVNVAKCR
jgi:hypothetical protein